MHGSMSNLKGAFKQRALRKPISHEQLQLLEQLYQARAREHFYEYRCYMNPDMVQGWWQREVAQEFMDFYVAWRQGLRPVLILEAPPQHGKSKQTLDFISWCSGKHPDTKSIYASYSDELGTTANSTLQRIYATQKFQSTFQCNFLNLEGSRRGLGGFARNSGVIEYQGHEGTFRNTTVNGQITGMGLGLGIIDDPMKGRAAANSPTIREKTWEWFTDDFFTRFAEYAGMIMIMTRWHLDDPAGRFKERYPHARVLKYPAIAEEDELYRKKGEALFPELKSLEFLLQRKTVMRASSWESLYQQNPTIKGGDMFPIDQFKFLEAVPIDQIKRSVRYWDKAGTEEGTGATTCGVLLHLLLDGRVLIEDVVRGRWSALQRERRIKLTADLDNRDRLVETWVEQEPGSGGKESAEATIRNLAGYRVYADRVTGKKEDRADGYAAQVEAGNVILLKAPWNKEYINEHEVFPNGRLKDQVDATSGAFNKATIRKSTYDTSMSWVTGGANNEAE